MKRAANNGSFLLPREIYKSYYERRVSSVGRAPHFRGGRRFESLFGKWAEDYKKASYSQWAVDELRDFIAEQIYPRREGSIDEFCKLTHEFMMKTAKYARVNPNTSLMFRSASEMAANILDLLRAMQ